MKHQLKSIYNKANKNRTPPKEPLVTTYFMNKDEMNAKYGAYKEPSGKRYVR